MDKLIAIIIDKLDWKHTYKNRIAAMNLIIHWSNFRYTLLPSMRDELDEIEELEDISVVLVDEKRSACKRFWKCVEYDSLGR